MLTANAMARGVQKKPRAPRHQLELEGVARFPVRRRGRGGKRANAGRKLAPGKRSSVPHRVRAPHFGRHPVHVTLRAGRRLPSLRSQLVSKVLREVLHRQRRRWYAGTFQVVELSIQDDHIHLIVEATGIRDTGGKDAADSLRVGISGLVIAFAKQLNGVLHRKGKVWGDRWHGRELASPSEVRSALVYVFRNVAKHGAYLYGDGLVDHLSSAAQFTGWTRAVVTIVPPEPWPELRPMTWLLGTGWHVLGGGLIDPNEARRRGP